MIKYVSIYLLFTGCLALAQEQHRITIKPFSPHIDQLSNNTFFSKISHLSAQGNTLYISSKDDPYILELNLETRRSRVFGKKGSGPGEFERGVLSLAVDGEDVWALDSLRKKRLVRFRDGVHKNDYQIYSRGFSTSQTAHTFAVKNKKMLFPVTPSSRMLAAAYDPELDTKELFGDLLFDESQAELLRICPDMNATLWAYGNDHWYAIFAYAPVMMKFDKQLKLVDTSDINHGPLLDRYNEKILKFEPRKSTSLPGVLFSDIVFHNDHLYLLGQPWLYELDPSGKVLSISSFIGGTPEFEEPIGPLFLNSMAILKNGTMILGTEIMMWDQELWQVKPPFLQRKPKTTAGR